MVKKQDKGSNKDKYKSELEKIATEAKTLDTEFIDSFMLPYFFTCRIGFFHASLFFHLPYRFKNNYHKLKLD
ncbi:hypothetical protein EfmJHP9_14840 [Enterococcus faecium]|nr:hypothetical protein EfmJHP9_14840 [Enterococcus faecium]